MEQQLRGACARPAPQAVCSPAPSLYCRSNDVRGMMEQNRAMLAERGERLAALDERTREMADDAEDFATMARRLEQQMANRKWWQL